MAKRLIYVKVLGTGIFEKYMVKDHTIEAHGNSTYHKFILPNDSIFYLNDFGIRSVTVSDTLEGLD